MKVAVLALQGAFIEHEQMLGRLGVDTVEVRQLSQWQQFLHSPDAYGVILPGGESTVQMRLLRSLGLFQPLREAILGGMPVLGTCAGMILLSEGYLSTMDMRVRRNAYGRQLGSFHTAGAVEGLAPLLPMTFIRAPYVEALLSGRCRPLAQVGGHIVAVSQGRQIATAFHPELDDDTRLHEWFLGRL